MNTTRIASVTTIGLIMVAGGAKLRDRVEKLERDVSALKIDVKDLQKKVSIHSQMDHRPEYMQNKKVDSDAVSPENVIPDDDMLQKRQAFIDNLIQQGVIEKVEFLGALKPRVYVTDVFLSANERQQNDLLNVIFAYAMQKMGKAPLYLRVKYADGTEFGRNLKIYDPINGQH